jgi:hypothetical protein
LSTPGSLDPISGFGANIMARVGLNAMAKLDAMVYALTDLMVRHAAPQFLFG